MLIGDKVYLRPLKLTDLEKTLSWRNDMFIKESTMSHPFPVTYEQEKEWYDNILSSKDKTKIYFAVCIKKSQEIIGYMFLCNIDWVNRNCYVCGAIGDRENVGKGLGREAVELIIKYAFANLNMHKVYAYVNAKHPALKIWYETGAVAEGELKNHIWRDDKYEDVLILAWYSGKEG